MFLVAKLYKCRNGHNEVPATDPEILERIPKSYLVFILKHRAGMTKSCVERIEEKIDAGISVSMVQTLIKERYQHDICRRQERFWTNYRCSKEAGLIRSSGNGINVPSYKELYQEMSTIYLRADLLPIFE